MNEKQKIPARAGTRNRGKTMNGVKQMSFIQSITKLSRRQVRALIVRAIEDAIVLLLMGACIWTICYLVSEILSKMGVA